MAALEVLAEVEVVTLANQLEVEMVEVMVVLVQKAVLAMVEKVKEQPPVNLVSPLEISTPEVAEEVHSQGLLEQAEQEVAVQQDQKVLP